MVELYSNVPQRHVFLDACRPLTRFRVVWLGRVSQVYFENDGIENETIIYRSLVQFIERAESERRAQEHE